MKKANLLLRVESRIGFFYMLDRNAVKLFLNLYLALISLSSRSACPHLSIM